MKQTIIMTQGSEVLFKGKPMNLPFKDDAIKAKSLELFDDEDPCIIHQSHIAREFTKTLTKVFEENNTKTIHLADFKDTLYFIDAPKDTTLTLKG